MHVQYDPETLACRTKEADRKANCLLSLAVCELDAGRIVEAVRLGRRAAAWRRIASRLSGALE